MAPKVGYAAVQDRVGKRPHPVKVQEHDVVGISGIDERPTPITDNVACAAAAYGKQEEILAAEHEGERGRPPHGGHELPGADDCARAVDAVLYIRRRRNQ